MKLMRKLEKQALARAAKEARKQQGKLKFFCVLEVMGVSLVAVFFFVGQLVTSNRVDLNGCKVLMPPRHSGDSMYIFIFITLKHKL